jgi:hypothetical protein
MERIMTDLADDLKERFDWAMYQCQEAYVVLPDGKSFERSDEDERLIAVFKNLFDSVDAIPSSLIETAEQLRAAAPELFEELLAQAIEHNCSSTSATEFVEVLNRTVQRDMAQA